MTRDEAKRILMICRPGVDWAEPSFHEALAFARRDPELAAWLHEQELVYDAIRGSLREIPVPNDLAEKILARSSRRRISPAIWQLAAAFVALIAVGMFWMTGRQAPPAFAHYRASMTKLVSKKYPMGLESSDPDRVRKFLANNQSPANYVLPEALRSTPLLGCATLTWGANPVSLLCFRRADGGDLWLFVTTPGQLAESPPTSTPVLAESNGLATASWRDGDKVYLLATRDGFDRLKTYLTE